MPPFVTDSTVLIPGLREVRSLERRLLVVCLYGRLRNYETFGSEEVENNPDFRAGAPLLGRSIRELQEEAGDRASMLADRLPGVPPRDFLLILSTPILDGLEQTLRRGQIGRGLGLSDEHSLRHRHLAAHLAAAAPQLSLAAVPQRTGHQDLDQLLETAVQARAPFLVSDSPLVEPLYGKEIQDAEGSVAETEICAFEHFLDRTVVASYLNDVDGGLLDLGL